MTALWVPSPWFVQTPKGEGLVKVIFDYTATENPLFMVELHNSDILCFDMKDCKGCENHTYGIERKQWP